MAERELRVIVRVRDEGAVERLKDLGLEVERVGTHAGRSEKGVLELGKGIGRLGTSAFIAYDRFSIALNAVENAQIRQQLATMRVQFAIEQYGAGSRQAVIAQQELEISTRGVEIAQQRMWVRVAFGVGVVIPEFIRGTREMIKVLGALSQANIFATLTTHGLTRAKLALLAVSTFGVGAIIGVAAVSAVAPEALGFGGGAPQSPVNVYGDINVQGGRGMSPADFAKQVSSHQSIQAATEGRR